MLGSGLNAKAGCARKDIFTKMDISAIQLAAKPATARPCQPLEIIGDLKAIMVVTLKPVADNEIKAIHFHKSPETLQVIAVCGPGKSTCAKRSINSIETAPPK